jgi:hypothetical protein
LKVLCWMLTETKYRENGNVKKKGANKYVLSFGGGFT